MFLIDFERKGNVLKLYFGSNKDYWGDDWDDRPYEHNAELVYDEFIEKTECFAFPFEYDILTAESDWHYGGNSPFSKEDMKNNKIPCLLLINNVKLEEEFSILVGSQRADILKVYFNTNYEELKQKILDFGGIII